MKILIDIGHPAHVHYFKHFAWEMQKNGHIIFFTCRDKEFEIILLKHYGFHFKSFGKKFNTRTGKGFGLVKFDFQEFLSGFQFKPDIFLSHGSMYAALAAFLLRKPHISLEDTGNWEQVRLYLPFTSAIITSDKFPYDYKEKQIRIKSHNELAYLYPGYFQPDRSFIERHGLNPHEQYVIVRFVAWNASHDQGQKGFNELEKVQIINMLSEKVKVWISSENILPVELENYRIPFAPYEIHDALYFSDMFIGEGTTMAMEAAILGTPSVYINTLQYCNVEEMEKYGLLFNYSKEPNKRQKIIELISRKDLKVSLIENRQKMLSEKINLTAFLVWFIENWPESFRIMKKNPEYQEKFK